MARIQRLYNENDYNERYYLDVIEDLETQITMPLTRLWRHFVQRAKLKSWNGLMKM